MTQPNPYDKKYAAPGFYWGTKPSAMCDRVIEIVRPSGARQPRLLDLGCGEGRNAVYFARNGFDVVGIDTSPPGVAKTAEYARQTGVNVRALVGDIRSWPIDGPYDVIFSTGTLHYLAPEFREARFGQFKAATPPGGIHAISLFVRKPFIGRAPDGEATAHPYRSGELFGYYWDWEIVYCTEEVFDCNSGGVPHRHACNRVIARRPNP